MSEYYVSMEITIKIKSPDIYKVSHLAKELVNNQLLSKDIIGYEIKSIEKDED